MLPTRDVHKDCGSIAQKWSPFLSLSSPPWDPQSTSSRASIIPFDCSESPSQQSVGLPCNKERQWVGQTQKEHREQFPFWRKGAFNHSYAEAPQLMQVLTMPRPLKSWKECRPRGTKTWKPHVTPERNRNVGYKKTQAGVNTHNTLTVWLVSVVEIITVFHSGVWGLIPNLPQWESLAQDLWYRNITSYFG